MRLMMIAAAAGLLAAAAAAQNVRSGTSAGIAKAPLAPAGSADAAVARPARGRAAPNGARPGYNLNEGANRIGSFAGGRDRPRARGG